jgi:hypothetical protein
MLLKAMISPSFDEHFLVTRCAAALRSSFIFFNYSVLAFNPPQFFRSLPS